MRGRNPALVVALAALLVVGCGSAAGPTLRPAFSLTIATATPAATATPRASSPPSATTRASSAVVTAAPTSSAPPTSTPAATRTPTAAPSRTPRPTGTATPAPTDTATEDPGNPASRALLVGTLLEAEQLPDDLKPSDLEESEVVNDPAFAANDGIRVVRIVWHGSGDGEIFALFDYRYQFPTADAAAAFFTDAEAFLSESGSGMAPGDDPGIGEASALFTGEVQGLENFNYNVLFRIGNVVAKIWVNVASTQDPDVPLGVARNAAARVTKALGLGTFPNEDEAALLAVVPAEIRDSCHRADPIYRDEVDTITCDGSTSHPPIDYSLFRTVSAMDGAFDRDIDRADPAPTTEGSCDEGNYTDDYTIDGQPGGRILCTFSTDEAGRRFRVIEWTNVNRRVLTFMSSSTRSWENLLEFWRDKAGPTN